jgi:phage shock protein A
MAETRGRKLKQLQDELDGREKEITEQQDAVHQLQNRVNELESQLAKFKSIDLNIEKKKRATTP